MLRQVTRTQPEQDRRNIAARAKRDLRAAARLLGPAAAYGRHIVWDTVTGEQVAIAYCCRQPQAGWLPTPEQSFGAMLDEKRTDKSFATPAGVTIFFPRYQVTWGIVEDYNPVPQEILDERRAKRKAKKAETARQHIIKTLPLFLDQLDEPEQTPAAEPIELAGMTTAELDELFTVKAPVGTP